MPAVQFQATLQVSASLTDPVEVDLLNEQHLVPLIQLMPQGLAWDYSEGTPLRRLLRGVALTFGRIDVWQRAVIRQLDPHTASFALENWEKLLGLTAGDLDELERRLKILAKLRARGGQSGPYFKEQLETLGYQNVVITRLGDPFRCGDRLRKRLQNGGWMYAFLISATSIPELDDEMMSAIRAGLRATVAVHFNLT